MTAFFGLASPSLGNDFHSLVNLSTHLVNQSSRNCRKSLEHSGSSSAVIEIDGILVSYSCCNKIGKSAFMSRARCSGLIILLSEVICLSTISSKIA